MELGQPIAQALFCAMGCFLFISDMEAQVLRTLTFCKQKAKVFQTSALYNRQIYWNSRRIIRLPQLHGIFRNGEPMRNILIINKDGNVAAEIQEHLRNPLSKIVCVPTVQAAAPYLASEEYCLIILDASISSQEDERLIQIVKRAKTTPILVLSSEFDPAERLQSLQSGAHAYMGKPYSLEECLAQAHAHMRRADRLKICRLFFVQITFYEKGVVLLSYNASKIPES